MNNQQIRVLKSLAQTIRSSIKSTKRRKLHIEEKHLIRMHNIVLDAEYYNHLDLRRLQDKIYNIAFTADEPAIEDVYLWFYNQLLEVERTPERREPNLLSFTPAQIEALNAIYTEITEQWDSSTSGFRTCFTYTLMAHKLYKLITTRSRERAMMLMHYTRPRATQDTEHAAITAKYYTRLRTLIYGK